MLDFIIGRMTTDKVLSLFHKAISRLEKIAAREMDEAGRLSDRADELADESMIHAGEAKRALQVADKLRALVA